MKVISIKNNRYEGLSCPVCHAKFFDDDDIVVCPVCGAPHHRDCYAQSGHCAYEAAHGTPDQWKEPDPSGETSADDSANTDSAETRSANTQGHICPRCNTFSGPDDNFCPRCGYDFHNGSGGNQFDPFGGARMPAFDPLGGVDKNSVIDGQSANEIATLVSVNTVRYMPKFADMKKSGSKIASWNWAAFLIPEYWFFYRKCNIAGAIATAVSIACTMLFYPLQAVIAAILPEGNMTYTALWDYLQQNADKIPYYCLLLAGVSLIITLIKSVVCGVLGDFILKRRCISTLEDLGKSDEYDSYDDRRAAIMRKGGVNLFAPIIVYMVVSMIESILITLI